MKNKEDPGKLGYKRRRKPPIFGGQHYAHATKNIVNKTWAYYKKTRIKDDPNIVFMRKLQQISHHRTQNVKPHNRTTLKLKGKLSQNRMWTKMLPNGRQFLLIIRFPSRHPYIQSCTVKGSNKLYCYLYMDPIKFF